MQIIGTKYRTFDRKTNESNSIFFKFNILLSMYIDANKPNQWECAANKLYICYISSDYSQIPSQKETTTIRLVAEHEFHFDELFHVNFTCVTDIFSARKNCQYQNAWNE